MAINNDILNTQNLELIRSYKTLTCKIRKNIVFKKIVEINTPYVVNFVKNYPIEMQEDLIQDCNLALFKAIEDFDLEKYNNFLTYATWKMKHQTKETKRLSGYKNTSIYAQRIIDAYEKYPNKDRNLSEIASDLGVRTETLRNALNSKNMMLPLEEGLLSDRFIEIEHEDFLMSSQLRTLISQLTDREQIVVNKFFGIGCSQESLKDIGLRLSPPITRQMATNIYNKAIKKIRRRLKQMEKE